MRMPKVGLDDLDRQIIVCLQDSGRVSNTEIARALKVSESTVRKRVDRLIQDEVIRIAAVPNPLKMDYQVVAILCIQAVPNKISAVAESLEKLTELRFIGLTTGIYDFMAEAWFKTMDELTEFLTKRLLPIDGLARVDTAHVLKMIRYAYDWGRDVVPTPNGDGSQYGGARAPRVARSSGRREAVGVKLAGSTRRAGGVKNARKIPRRDSTQGLKRTP